MNITFKIALFKDKDAKIGLRKEVQGLNRHQSEKALLWLLEALVQTNRAELRTSRINGSKIPPLYKSGVRYLGEEGTENWKDAITVYKDGFGDCEDLAAWRVAELRNNGKKARPYIRYKVNPETGMYIYHVMVLRHDGLEDPSRVLGMNGGR